MAAAADLLRAWAGGDFDGFADALDSIATDSEALIAELRRQEGDARGIQPDLEDELARLIGLVRGSLYLTRHAVDLALDPPLKGRFLGRGEVLDQLVDGD